jgi:hypothetical protein
VVLLWLIHQWILSSNWKNLDEATPMKFPYIFPTEDQTDIDEGAFTDTAIGRVEYPVTQGTLTGE